MSDINPYSLTFGKTPLQMISRLEESDEIIDNFQAKISPQQIYMITGVRGSGKTVQMTEISKCISRDKNWVVVELNTSGDILLDMASKLYHHKAANNIIKNASINLSFWGIGLDIEGSDKITNLEVAIGDILESLKKQDKRVLVTMDEVTDTESMRVFASSYQIYVRQDLPVYLLMTGLYENIDALQNEKNLTFLHRAPKIQMLPLNTGSIVRHYKRTFDITDTEAREMAKATMGYPFAFQVLGYYTYLHNGDYRQAMDEYLDYIDSYSYNKIWSELSHKDRQVLYALANSDEGNVSDVKTELGQMS